MTAISEAAPRAADGRLSRPLVAIMATATGAAVASNYYAQPLLPVMRHDLHMSAAVAGLMVTVAQVGYAAGLVLLLPLGDLVERRRLVVTLSWLAASGLVVVGLAPSSAVLLPAAFAVGVVSVMAQVLVPFAASLAGDFERGRVVGIVMSGLLLGILLARTVAGALAQAGTWRVVYFVAAGVMAVQGLVLRARLPRYREAIDTGYGRLLKTVLHLVRDEPVLRLRGLYGLLTFGTFSVLWTSVAFLLADRYHFGPAVIGLFGLIGAAGAVAASMAGRLSDAGRERSTTGITSALLVLSWVLLWLGRDGIGWLVAGILLLDVGTQGLHITNQGAIYRLRAEARSRLTAAYMAMYFAGGAAGSALSAELYAAHGWDGVTIAGAVFATAAFVVWLIEISLAGNR
ncbi:MAG TPA: MFS transporter [Mycobacteriales bacterium]|nr:MFS transporter [Mycobacteriales bacterium]